VSSCSALDDAQGLAQLVAVRAGFLSVEVLERFLERSDEAAERQGVESREVLPVQVEPAVSAASNRGSSPTSPIR
jgi:hypothetical protein